ncbi:MAG: CHASE2 domain-containing protein [Rubrivivax sp.]
MLLLSNSGFWQYLSSSFAAHDLRRAAHWSSETDAARVVVVAIDDKGFNSYFGGRSPLDRERLRDLLQAVDQGAPAQATLVVDLDLSPSARDAASRLSPVWADAKPHRWVLADPVLQSPDPDLNREQWRSALCAAGIRFGFPHIPTEFGYTSGSHQFQASLVQVAASQEMGCSPWRRLVQIQLSPEGRVDLRRTAFVLDPSSLRQGLVIPFQGDLAQLRDILAQLQPQLVVIGGMWGNADVFLTPFGERYGLQVHAAALEGQARGLRLAPHAVRLLVGWLVVSCLSLCFALMYQALARSMRPWIEGAAGHRFLFRRLWPMFMTLVALLALLGVSEMLAVIHARLGYWIPSASVAIMVLGSLLFVWNWGLNELVLRSDVRQAWRSVVVDPIVQDWHGLGSAMRRMLDISAAEMMPGPEMSRARAFMEALLCLCSLASQTLLPLAALWITLTKPL